jgi:Rod binding domain-containing protein
MRVESIASNVISDTNSKVAKLKQHATEFEGILLTEMLGKLQHTFASTEGGQDGDAASDTISSLGTQALAQALAQRNALGIGAMIARSLSGTTTPVTPGPLHFESTAADIQSKSENK